MASKDFVKCFLLRNIKTGKFYVTSKTINGGMLDITWTKNPDEAAFWESSKEFDQKIKWYMIEGVEVIETYLWKHIWREPKKSWWNW